MKALEDYIEEGHTYTIGSFPYDITADPDGVRKYIKTNRALGVPGHKIADTIQRDGVSLNVIDSLPVPKLEDKNYDR